MPDGGSPFSPEQPDAPPGTPTNPSRGFDMHGGLPFIGFSTIVYGVVGLALATGSVVTRFRRRR
jgi:hypothetical protein